MAKYLDTVGVAVRFLDNVLDVSNYPFDDIEHTALRGRKIGLNALAGLGDALAMMKVPYNSELARNFTKMLQLSATVFAYNTSIYLAAERGTFPAFDYDKYIKSGFIENKLIDYINIDLLKVYGIRNVTLMTCPPVGTGSLYAGNISNGIEPIFDLEYERKIKQPDETYVIEEVEDYAWSLYKALGKPDGDKPDYFITAKEIDPIDHIKMQSCIQKFCCSSISKTINIPNSYTLDSYKDLIRFSFKSGVKGTTTYRAGTRDGVLISKDDKGSNVNDTITSNINNNHTEYNVEKRPFKLSGDTYQIPDANGKHVYCTINHIDGKPWELFTTSSGKNSEWYAAIGRLASRIMRKTGDIEGVIEELKDISADTGYLTKEYGYVNGKVQHIGLILESFYNDHKEMPLEASNLTSETITKETDMIVCPSCGEASYIKQGGCGACSSCGYSACG